MITMNELKNIAVAERVDMIVVDTTASPEMREFAENLIADYKAIRYELANTAWRPKFLAQLEAGLDGVTDLYSRLRNLFDMAVAALSAFRKAGGSQWDKWFLATHDELREIGSDLDDLELHGKLPRLQADRRSIHGKLAL